MTSRKALIPMAVSLLAVAVCAPAGRAQDSQGSQPSVADAARKAREQQKSEPKTAKVFTDDDVANLKGGISVVGSDPTPAPTDAATAAAAKEKATPAPAVKDEAYWRKRFADARRKLADDSKELDVLQREYNLKEVQFYSNPNVALREQYSRKDLDDTLAEINAKKAAVDKDNQALSDLQDELRTSGGEPGWANEEPQPTPQTESDSDSSQTSQPQAEQPAVTSHEPPQIVDQPEQSETPSPAQQQ
jgi:hypothetical protein